MFTRKIAKPASLGAIDDQGYIQRIHVEDKVLMMRHKDLLYLGYNFEYIDDIPSQANVKKLAALGFNTTPHMDVREFGGDEEFQRSFRKALGGSLRVYVAHWDWELFKALKPFVLHGKTIPSPNKLKLKHTTPPKEDVDLPHLGREEYRKVAKLTGPTALIVQFLLDFEAFTSPPKFHMNDKGHLLIEQDAFSKHYYSGKKRGHVVLKPDGTEVTWLDKEGTWREVVLPRNYRLLAKRFKRNFKVVDPDKMMSKQLLLLLAAGTLEVARETLREAYPFKKLTKANNPLKHHYKVLDRDGDRKKGVGYATRVGVGDVTELTQLRFTKSAIPKGHFEMPSPPVQAFESGQESVICVRERYVPKVHAYLEKQGYIKANNFYPAYFEKDRLPMYEKHWDTAIYWLLKGRLQNQDDEKHLLSLLSEETTKKTRATKRAAPPKKITVQIRHTKAKNGIEVEFPHKPSETIRDFLKKVGMNWNSKEGWWFSAYSVKLFEYIKQSFAKEDFSGKGAPKPSAETPSKPEKKPSPVKASTPPKKPTAKKPATSNKPTAKGQVTVKIHQAVKNKATKNNDLVLEFSKKPGPGLSRWLQDLGFKEVSNLDGYAVSAAWLSHKGKAWVFANLQNAHTFEMVHEVLVKNKGTIPKELTEVKEFDTTLWSKKNNCVAFNMPIQDIHVDTKRFQNRQTAFSEASARSVAMYYDPNRFDPIVVWKDPKGNKVFVVSGHSRLEGRKRADAMVVAARWFVGTESEAIKFARVEANRSANQENLTEDILAYRLLRDGSKQHKIKKHTKKELREIFGSRTNKLEALSYLNPAGLFISALSQANATEYPFIERIATWVGNYRKKHKEKLTNTSEQNLFFFFYADAEGKHLKLKKEDLDKMMQRRITGLKANEVVLFPECNSAGCKKKIAEVEGTDRYYAQQSINQLLDTIAFIRKRLASNKPELKVWTEGEREVLVKELIPKLQAKVDLLKKNMGDLDNQQSLFGLGRSGSDCGCKKKRRTQATTRQYQGRTPQVTPPRKGLGNSGVVSMAEAMKVKNTAGKMEFGKSPFGRFMGKLAKDAVLLVSGPTRSGKTPLVLSGLRDMAQTGKVLLVSAELIPGTDIFNDYISDYVDQDTIDKISVMGKPEEGLNTLLKVAQHYDIVIVDSALKAGMNPEDIDKLRWANTGTLWIVIQQVTADGKVRGGGQSAHDPDYAIAVEGREARWTKRRGLKESEEVLPGITVDGKKLLKSFNEIKGKAKKLIGTVKAAKK